MNLVYRVVEAQAVAGAGTPSAVLLHGQGGVPIDQLVALARRGGLGGELVVPFGDYATTPSGMEVGGPCWYRSLPGGAGTDPLTLTRAVVQVTDLLEDASLDRPVLVGWRQGAAVAIGVGLHVPAAVGAVVAVDTPASHLRVLPVALHVADAVAPPALLVETGAAEDADGSAAKEELDRRGLAAEVWPGPGDGDGRQPAANGENEEVVAQAVARIVGAVTGRSVGEGSSR